MQEDSDLTQPERSGKLRFRRLDPSKALETLSQRQAKGFVSQRQFSRDTGIPRTTLQHWIARKAPKGVEPEISAFFETPAGIALLKRILLAVHLVCCFCGTGGIRMVCLFLSLAGLSPFVASSYGAQHSMATSIQEHIVTFGKTEKKRLSKQMPPKKITACEDENFHSGSPMLVAIEPVSNFILLEQFAEKRDTDTWNAALAEAITDMPVEIVQITSDEAKAFIRQAKTLGAQQSPDLFHIQNGVCQAMSLPLHRQLERAEEEAEDAQKEVLRQEQALAVGKVEPRRQGRPPDFPTRLQGARFFKELADGRLTQARAVCTEWRTHLHTIRDGYHPYDLETGAPRSPEQLDTLLGTTFEHLRQISKETHLSENSRKLLEKSERMVPKMVATLRFYERCERQQIDALGLPPDEEALLRNHLIPAAYLERVARQSEPAERRRTLQARAVQLRAGVSQIPLDRLSGLQAVADACIHVFQRSSSCVEGRNGRLSQYHHALRGLTVLRQNTLTVLHNYLPSQSGEPTPAERFFGARPADLVGTLLEQLPDPPRPARSRKNDPLAQPLESANWPKR